MATAFTFSAYRSSNAFELFCWAQKENNRIKASRIKRAADKMEARHRGQYAFSRELPHQTYRPLPPPKQGG